MATDKEFLKSLIHTALQEVLEAEMTDAARRREGECSEGRRGYCSATTRAPNAESCLRLIRAPTVERHGVWLDEHYYLNMDLLEEHKEALHWAV